MKIGKKLIPIGVVILFVGIAFVPSASAASPRSSGDEKTLTIWIPASSSNLPGITEDDFTIQVTVSGEQLDELTAAMKNFTDYAELAMEDNKINIGEWAEFKTLTNDMLTIVKEIVGELFPDVDTDELVEEIISTFMGPLRGWTLRAPIFSIGRGYTWIPFYKYESFMGVMIRPMFITHTLGFTAVVHANLFPFRLEYADRLGMYRIRTMGFVGLFINLGDVGVDKIKGPVLLIGKGFNGLGEDLP